MNKLPLILLTAVIATGCASTGPTETAKKPVVVKKPEITGLQFNKAATAEGAYKTPVTATGSQLTSILSPLAGGGLVGGLIGMGANALVKNRQRVAFQARYGADVKKLDALIPTRANGLLSEQIHASLKRSVYYSKRLNKTPADHQLSTRINSYGLVRSGVKDGSLAMKFAMNATSALHNQGKEKAVVLSTLNASSKNAYTPAQLTKNPKLVDQMISSASAAYAIALQKTLEAYVK